MLPLRSKTDPRWIELATSRFDEVIVDHAHCEKKAAASAMALVTAYPDHDLLVKRLARLAHEELRHFRQVYDRISARGLKLSKDEGDPYVQSLIRLVRTTPAERRMDRLLVSALVEARSCERLELLSEALEDPELRSFYATLARAEAGHHTLFVDLAATYAPQERSGAPPRSAGRGGGGDRGRATARAADPLTSTPIGTHRAAAHPVVARSRGD
ncbi:tRNA-(ms[2]io[6]A)-hydroxylase [Vulgatibacter incomptus]|uniref:tRNA-(Ms[2]io[6]A)-hydroxylase n=1 Tax=Vulgatibacter incomptus TaxID=1391653 RepID=A0A0K1PGY5_9BACT|nr:tRNA-(ms[2]io[6]A)-hydroxylase [Vulgatibacter incomptus]AKU92775.1 tRNA-(ms[2]io[6]A)-hydroxylase [Vulgatibacter incomptus]